MKVSYGVVCLAVTSIVVSMMGCGARNAAPSAAGSTGGDSPEASATAVVDELAAGNFSAVTARFDATMAAALSEPALRQTWQALTAQLGAFKSRGDARLAEEAGMEVVYVPCTFERGALTAKVVFDSQHKIAGLFFQ